MALPDSTKLVAGTPIVLADTTDHSPAAANNLGTRTDQLDLTSVGDNASRQSDKIDFGANRAPQWRLDAALEFAATPTAGEVVNFYLAFSSASAAANGNPGGVSGSDSAFSGYSSNMADSLKQLLYVGSFVCTAQATGTVQIQTNVAVFTPFARYATLVVENQSGAALHSDAVECSVVLSPIETQIQD